MIGFVEEPLVLCRCARKSRVCVRFSTVSFNYVVERTYCLQDCPAVWSYREEPPSPRSQIVLFFLRAVEINHLRADLDHGFA
jgi:hypothetical protein